MNLGSVVYFYSSSFLAFLLGAFVFFWSVPQRYKTRVLLLISYAFYCCWDYRFLSLILISSATDYWVAQKIEEKSRHRKKWLYLSLAVNLGLLSIFKYMNFFIDSARAFGSFLGFELDPLMLNIVLPLGISFYTFQTMGYSLDVYRDKIKAIREPFTFFLFVGYFPQLIAGPIEKSTFLLPQLKNPKFFRDIRWQEASYLFCYGFFKKRVVADFFAYVTENGYESHEKSGIVILLGFIAYTLQVYADISGYVDMARGVSLLFGIRLSSNFNFPYFSKNPVEFWKRWHITLSMWARNYVFNPLLVRTRMARVAILVTFLVMGLWHGPKWHYVHWGIYWAFWSIVYQVDSVKKIFSYRIFMLLVILIGQSFFNAESLESYFALSSSLFRGGFWSKVVLGQVYLKFYLLAVVWMAYEWWLSKYDDEQYLLTKSFYLKSIFYFVLMFLYRNMGGSAALDFIYFQF